jgi:Flp pilus assembly protein TadD
MFIGRMAGGRGFDYSRIMKIFRDSLVLGLILLSVPALAATPKRAATKPPAAPAAPADPAGDLISQARAAQAKGESELAVRLAQSAIVADPARPATYNALADLYAADGEADSARFYYGQALNIDPTDRDATSALAALDRTQRAAKADASAK